MKAEELDRLFDEGKEDVLEYFDLSTAKRPALQKTWKTQEILQFCSSNLVSEAKVYVKAIRDKIDRIIFAVQRLSVSDTSIPKNFDSRTLRFSELEVMIYTESIATNLHSLADVLAHVINVIVLKPLQSESDYLKSQKISIYKVKDKLEKLNTIDSVRSKYIAQIIANIYSLINSDEFKYVKAFVNTIKHRSLIDTEFAIVRQNGSSLIDIGYRFDSFDYEIDDKKFSFPQTQCKIIAIDYRQKIIDLVFDVGNSINNYCRAVYLSGDQVK